MTEQELLSFLDAQSVAYELYRHDPIFSAKDPTPASIPRPELIVKNLLLESSDGSKRFLATLRADDRADLSGLARQLGVGHLSFVAGERMESLIGVTPGSATPFALLDHPKAACLVVDAALPHTCICCHPMHNAASIELACDDALSLLKDAGVCVTFADVAKRGGAA